MSKRTSFLALLALLTVVPQQASAYITVVERIGEQDYLFQADNAGSPIVGEAGGFKVRISKIDFAADPTFESATPATGLTDMLRLNMYHPDTESRQTTVLQEESPGLYVARFTPTQPGQYTFTVAALLEGFPLSIPFTCLDPNAEEGEADEGDETEPTDTESSVEQLLMEGDMPCPAGQEARLMFPPSDEEIYYGEDDGGVTHEATGELQDTINSLVVSRTILYVITGINLILSAVFGILLSRAVF